MSLQLIHMGGVLYIMLEASAGACKINSIITMYMVVMATSYFIIGYILNIIGKLCKE